MNRNAACKHFKKLWNSGRGAAFKFSSVQGVHPGVRHQWFASRVALPADCQIRHTIVNQLDLRVVEKSSNVSTQAEECEAEPIFFLTLIHVIDDLENWNIQVSSKNYCINRTGQLGLSWAKLRPRLANHAIKPTSPCTKCFVPLMQVLHPIKNSLLVGEKKVADKQTKEK